MVLFTIGLEIQHKNHPEFLQTFSSVSKEVRLLKGCICYHIYQNFEQKKKLCLHSVWIDKDSLKAFTSSKNFKITMGAIKTLSALPKMEYGVIESIDPENLLNDL